eukprot:2755832-Pyramimonas_sp.AAC.1
MSSTADVRCRPIDPPREIRAVRAVRVRPRHAEKNKQRHPTANTTPGLGRLSITIVVCADPGRGILLRRPGSRIPHRIMES